MRAKYLKLVNIRSYQEEKIEFPEGTTLFEGDIGSGKSTILLAIEFALFGLGDQKGASLLRLGAKEGSVTFTFELNGDEYEVQRKLVRKGNTVQQKEGYLIINGKRYDLSPTELKEKILEILKFNEPPNPNAQSVIYRYAIFTPQEEMKAILWAKPQERLQTLRKAFGIEDYRTAAENAKTLIGKIKEKSDFLKGKIEDLEQKKKELEIKTDEIRKAEEQLETLSEEKQKLDSELRNQEEEIEKLREQEKELSSIQKLLPKLREDIKEKTKRKQKLQVENNDYKKEIEEQLQPQIEDLSKLQKPTDKNEKELQNIIDEMRRDEREIFQKVNSFKFKIEEYQQIIDNKICPTCDREVDPLEFGEKLNNLKKERDTAEEKRRKLAEDLENTQSQLDMLREYNKNQEKLNQLTKSLEDKKKKLTQNMEEILELSNQIERLDAEIKINQKRLDELKSVSENIEQAKNKLKTLKQQSEEIKDQISKTQKQIEIYKEYKEKLQAEIQEKEKQAKTKQLLDEHRIWLQDYFIPTLESIEKHVMRSINQEFNQQLQKWFAILVDDPGKSVRIDEEFTPIIEQDGYEQNINYMSGGEKTSLALVYRLALNNIVRKVSTAMKTNLLILDEPTDGFSKEQLSKVREILNELQDAQVILVSHERELESFADQVFKVEKRNGVSKVEIST
ncbi:MAG: SMC family ATPase [Candidatus Jordarchaeaceae archaeon]